MPLGVILLMFGVGIHLSLGDLWAVRSKTFAIQNIVLSKKKLSVKFSLRVISLRKANKREESKWLPGNRTGETPVLPCSTRAR